LDYSLTGKVKANTKYHFKAMVSSLGNFEFIFNGCGINGSTADYKKIVNTTGSWQVVDFYFTTGTLTGSPVLWMNSCGGDVANRSTLSYLDNLEIYEFPIRLSSSSLTYLAPGTKKVAVTGINLANDITITAPAHFSVSPSTLLKTVAGDSVAITYNGGTTASGYVVFTSGAIKDSIQVSGTADPIIVSSATNLILDDIAFKDSITVTAGNLLSDLTITAPAGITVNPTTISMSNSSEVNVVVTYDKTTPVSGNIALTSGTLTVNVAVKASSNAGCYTPVYASGNMIADPTFSAATVSAGGFGGWGTTALTHTRQYCGRGAAYIFGNCGGSIDRALTTANGNALRPLTKYRLRAMVNSQASADKTFQFEIGGVDGDASQKFQIGNTGGWIQFDTTFTTGATVVEKGIYFNSCTNGPTITDTCFIDNYELYSLGIVTQIAVTGTGGDTTVSIDKTLQMVASVLPADAIDKTFTWSVVNGTGSATLSNTGLLTPVSLGTVIVIATANDGSGTVDSLLITITVPIVLVTAINLEGTDLVTTITTNHGMLQVSATVLPFDATNKSLDYTIINGTGEATISNTGLVTALRNGTVTAIATAKDGSHVSDSLVITISGQIDVLVSSIVVTGADLATTITTLGGTLQVSATVLPVDAVNKSVDWSLENGTGEATISATGLVTAVKDGTVTAIATAKDSSNVSGSLVITISGQTQTILVSSITVTGANNDTTITTKAGTLQMLAEVLPADASNDTVVWSVTNGTGEATISATGLLTAAEDGTVTVKATATDGSAVSGSIVITISNQEDPIISVSDKDLSDVSIYPNPVEAEITISGNTSFRSIEIYNVDGTLINRLDNVASTSSINVSELTSGVYIIRLTTANECATKRFVKK
jgi:uncharacterized protein YjdB